MVPLRWTCDVAIASSLRLVVANVVALGLGLVVAATVSGWVLIVLPFAGIMGVSVSQGLALSQSWDAIGRAPDDPGIGPAGMSF